MSSLKENSVVVPDVWTGKRVEKDIAEFKVENRKQVKILRKRIEELEDSIDGIERAFWGGMIGRIVLDLAILAIAIF